MKVVPAIDLLDGRAVRLRAGRRDDVTVFSDEPWAVAAGFAAAGATLIHVVDLEGAFSGVRRQAAALEKVARASGVPVQVGGGVRSQADVDALLELGAAFVVLGTAAVKEPALVERLCRERPGRIVVAVDARDGQVAVEGWTRTATLPAVELAARVAEWGVTRVQYTDVGRDGSLTGLDTAAIARMAQAAPLRLTVGGGVHALSDLTALRALEALGVDEVIVGRALYDARFSLAEAREACA